MPALARNVVTNGYQAASSNEALEQTEYLKLVIRYLSQARELAKLAGADGAIKIETCESAQTGEILRVLGYRMRGGCGSEVVLETVNAMRAFLTIDSGFPLSELEQSLRTNRPFVYDYKPTLVPILYGPDYGQLQRKSKAPSSSIRSWAIHPCAACIWNVETRPIDRRGAAQIDDGSKIRAYAHVLDFYGGMFRVRNGRAIVPAARAQRRLGRAGGCFARQGRGIFRAAVGEG